MSPRLLRASLYAAFLLSGVAALVYEVLWSKYLSLFIGGTAIAHTIVLATFMGGLAAGNAIFGRRADSNTNLLRLYALLEIGIGMFCLLFPTFFAWLGKLYILLGTQTGPSSALNPALKAGLAAAAILLPCVLMGGTLPVLGRFVVSSLSGLGTRLGWLYFINTAGAVAGSLLGGFVVVERWGLELGMVFTSLVNFAIGAAFYIVSRSSSGPTGAQAATRPPTPDTSTEDASAEPSVTYSPRQARIALSAIAVAGALTMLYELVWFRLLVLSIGGTVHSFSTMLAGFIAGIAAGSYVCSRLMRRTRNALALFALCELGIALVTLLPSALFERLPFVFYKIGSNLVHTPETYGVYLASAVVFAVILMGPPAVFMGAALPLAGRVCATRIDQVGRTVGDVFSVNTVGNVAGALLTGLFLLPALELEGTLLLGGALSGGLGVLLLWAWRPTGPLRLAGLRDLVRVAPPAAGPRLWPFALLLVGALILVRTAAYPAWSPLMLQVGLYRWEVHRNPEAIADYSSFKRRIEAKTSVLYSRDGMDASVLVDERLVRMSGGDRPVRAVFVNGKADASTFVDLSMQLYVGHLGMFMHPAPKDVMVVGLGSGATAGAVLAHPQARVDVAEILPEMIEAARYFKSINNGVLSDPRASIALVDAREHLLLTRRQYDVIISEPTNVWIPGVAMLFTEDFYQVVRTRLNAGGLFCQWLQLYNMDRSIVGSTLAALGKVFPYVSLWTFSESDVVFLAALEPPKFDADAFHDRFRHVDPGGSIPPTDPLLPLLGDPVAFLASQVATDSARRLLALHLGGRPYRDFFPRMEFEAARAQFVAKPYRLLDELDERKHRVTPEPLFLETYLARRPLGDESRARLTDQQGALGPFARLGDSLLLASGADASATKLPHELAGTALRARALEQELGRQSPPEADTCSAYLDVNERFFGAASSVLTRPETSTLEERVEQCVAAHPARGSEFGARLVTILAKAWSEKAALDRFRSSIHAGTLQQLGDPDRLLTLVLGARLLIRAGEQAQALQVLAAALAIPASAGEDARHEGARASAGTLAAWLELSQAHLRR